MLKRTLKMGPDRGNFFETKVKANLATGRGS